MGGQHILNAAAAGPTPVEFLLVGIDQVRTARKSVTIVLHGRLVVHSDPAAGAIKQPVPERHPESSADRSERIARALANGVVSRGSGLSAAAIQVHVAAFGFDTQHQAVPLVIVTDLS